MKTKRRRKNNLFRLLKAFLTIVGFFMIFTFVVLLGYSFFSTDINTRSSGERTPGIGEGVKSITDIFAPIKDRTNFVLFGTDEDGTRTDLMMVGCFNATMKKIDLISIPRDTMVEMPKERVTLLQQEGKYVPRDGIMQINQVHHYAGSDHGLDFAVKQIEEDLNIDIEYYLEIDLEAFRYVIDQIGGIEFNVPQRMIYKDPYQNPPLIIDLQPGLQILYGKEAEGVVRYRKPSEGYESESPPYKMADLQRVQVQQDFMKALLSQVIGKENIISNAPALTSAFIKYVKTNFSLSDVPKYIKYIKEIKTENINTCTIPFELIGNAHSSKVYIIEDEKIELINSIFYSPEEIVKQQHNSKGKKIQILNGGYTTGLAQKTKDFLTEKGFTILNTGDYADEKTTYTRIIVKSQDEGYDIKNILDNSRIEINSNFSTEYDIVIILGTAAGGSFPK